MNNEPVLAKWLRYMVYASAFVPLVIFAQYMSPFHFGKAVVLRSLVEIMLALWLLLIWRTAEYRPKSDPVTWAFFAFTLAFTFTTVTSVAPIQSFWGTLERMGGLFTFWHFFAFYLMTVSVIRTREHWQTLIDLMLSVGLVSALYGFLQKTQWDFILGSGGRQRPFGTIGNPALFAGYQILIGFLAATLLLTKKYGPAAGVPRGSMERGGAWIGAGLLSTLILALMFREQGFWVIGLGAVFYGVYLMIAGASVLGAQWCYGIVAALTLLAAAMTAVRGSLLAMAVAVVVFGLLYSALNRSRRAKTALLASLAGITVFFFLAVMLRGTPLVQNSPYLRRITDFSGSTFTVQTRFMAWEAGLKGFTESPRYMVVGWGPENFNVPFSKYFNPKFFTGPGAETFFDRAHNMFMEILVTMGLVGIAAYLAMYGALFWVLSRLMRQPGDTRVIGIGFSALTVAYIIHNAFIFDTTANFLAFFTIVAFATHLYQRGLDGDTVGVKSARAVPWSGLQITAAGVLSLIALVSVFRLNVRPAQANYAATRAIIAGWQGDFVTAVNKYREAIDYGVAGRYEYRHRYAQYLLELASQTDVSKAPQFTDVTLRAIQDVQDNVDENPTDYLPLLYISRLYITLGKLDPAADYNDRALDYSARALQVSPTFVRTYYEVAQAYLNKGDADRALEWFAKAAELQPEVGITYWYMAVVQFQRGKVQDAIALVVKAIENGYVPTEEEAQKIIGALIEAGDFKSVATVYETLSQKFPSNVQYLSQLAAVYARLGERQKAIDAVRTAMTIDLSPQFQAEATAFIRQLGGQP